MDEPKTQTQENVVPYIIEDHTPRGVKKTKITTEQRMNDTDQYCKEITKQLKSIPNHAWMDEGFLSYEAILMNDSVFSENEIVSKPSFKKVQVPWWEDDDHLKEINDENKSAEERMKKYLNSSHQ